MPVEFRNRGATTREDIFLGVAFTCGLDKVVIPFLDKGIPVEYEIVRSIATVSQQKRKKLGVLITDAKLYATFDMQTMSPGRNEQIIEELQKQYEVVQVDAANPITEKYDVLLAVQPSSLGPEHMDNFVAAVKAGQPTAIFEDPFPWLSPEVPGTLAPRPSPGGNNPFMQQRTPPQPKGDINKLWQLLGVDFPGDSVVWQDYNPYPKFGAIPHEWVFIDDGSGAREPFNLENPISKSLQQVLFLYPGSVQGLNSSQLKFTELITTGERTGTIRADQLIERSMMGQPRMNPEIPYLEKPTKDKYTMAARIKGQVKTGNMPMSDKEPEAEAEAAKPEAGDAEPAETAETKPAEAVADAATDAKAVPKPDAKADAKPDAKPAPEINVVLVSDIDCLYSAFFALRARGDDPEQELSFQFDNVPFVLNVLDVLAGDERFVDIRTRRLSHRTLTKVNEATEGARKAAEKAREDFVRNFEKERAKVQKKFDDEMAALAKRENVNRQQATVEKLQAQMRGQQELDVALQRLKDKQTDDIKKSQNAMQANVRSVQDSYKFWAVVLPPIPPLIVALIVFFNRRANEREGVSKARLR
jgi:ABC-2 type transport system permease protein